MAFTPPPMYSFPPFFTLQPVDATRARQMEVWRTLVLSWHHHHGKVDMLVKDWPMWENKAIDRRMSPEGIKAVMEHIVSTGGGEWLDDTHTAFKIFTRSPAELAIAIRTHVQSMGMTGSAMPFTVYELHSGAAGAGSPMEGMDPLILMRALEHMERNGMAQLIRGESTDTTGVIFTP